MFLILKCCCIGAKSGLLKNIPIDPFDILLICINFAHAYWILFLNGRKLLFHKIDISAIYAMVFFLSTGSLAFFFLPSLNLIDLNPLWMGWIPDLDWLEQMVCLLSGGICLTSGISVSWLLPGIYSASSIPARSLQSRAGSLLSKASVYRLSFLLIGSTKNNMASALAIGKPFVMYRVSRETV